MKITKQQLKQIIMEELETALNEKRTPDYYAEAQDWRSTHPGIPSNASSKGWRPIDDSPDEPVLDDEGNLLPITDPNFEASTIKPGEQDGLFPGHLVGAHGDVYKKQPGTVSSDVKKSRPKYDPETKKMTGKPRHHWGTDTPGAEGDPIEQPIGKQQGRVTRVRDNTGDAGYYTDTEYVTPYGGYGVDAEGNPITGRAFRPFGDDFKSGTPMTTVRSMHHRDNADRKVGQHLPVDTPLATMGSTGGSTNPHSHIEMRPDSGFGETEGFDIDDAIAHRSVVANAGADQPFQTSDQARANLDRAIAARKAPAVASATPSKPTTPAPTVASATTPRDDDDDTGLDDTGLDEGIPTPGRNLAEAWGFNMDLSKLNE